MRRMIVSGSAEEDLFEIWEYFAPRNRAAADTLIAEISAAFGILVQNPLAGRRRPEFRKDLRSFSVGAYLIFYREVEDGIVVVRVLHGVRDLTELFRG